MRRLRMGATRHCSVLHQKSGGHGGRGARESIRYRNLIPTAHILISLSNHSTLIGHSWEQNHDKQGSMASFLSYSIIQMWGYTSDETNAPIFEWTRMLSGQHLDRAVKQLRQENLGPRGLSSWNTRILSLDLISKVSVLVLVPKEPSLEQEDSHQAHLLDNATNPYVLLCLILRTISNTTPLETRTPTIATMRTPVPVFASP